MELHSALTPLTVFIFSLPDVGLFWVWFDIIIHVFCIPLQGDFTNDTADITGESIGESIADQ